MTTPAPQGREVVDSAFRLLACVGASEPVRLIDLARESGLPRPTVHRLLAQLGAVGAVVKDGVLYRLGPTLLGLGEMAAQQRLRSVARRPMAELAAASGAAVFLSGPVGEGPVLLDAIDAREPLGLPLSDIGSAVASGTAMAQVHGHRRPGGTPGTGFGAHRPAPAGDEPAASRRPPALSVDQGGCDPDLSCAAAAVPLPQGGRAAVTAILPGARLPHALLADVRRTALRIRGLLTEPDAVPSPDSAEPGRMVH
jgi:DNA-binding IclR family transcriptional regulator